MSGRLRNLQVIKFGGLLENFLVLAGIHVIMANNNKPQQEGIPTKPGYKKLFILILQKTSNNN